jgi:hypothetical protein
VSKLFAKSPPNIVASLLDWLFFLWPPGGY